VISAKQRQRVLNYVEIGLKEGARLVSGGRVPADPALARGFFVEPTVFADVTPSMRIYQEEVFGPFTSITRFRDEAEAISLANDSPFGLAGAVRTSNLVRAHRVAAKLRCGIVWINDHHRLDPASPGRRRRFGNRTRVRHRILRRPLPDEERDGEGGRPAFRLVPGHREAASAQLIREGDREPGSATDTNVSGHTIVQ